MWILNLTWPAVVYKLVKWLDWKRKTYLWALASNLVSKSDFSTNICIVKGRGKFFCNLQIAKKYPLFTFLIPDCLKNLVSLEESIQNFIVDCSFFSARQISVEPCQCKKQRGSLHRQGVFDLGVWSSKRRYRGRVSYRFCNEVQLHENGQAH